MLQKATRSNLTPWHATGGRTRDRARSRRLAIFTARPDWSNVLSSEPILMLPVAFLTGHVRAVSYFSYDTPAFVARFVNPVGACRQVGRPPRPQRAPRARRRRSGSGLISFLARIHHFQSAGQPRYLKLEPQNPTDVLAMAISRNAPLLRSRSSGRADCRL
jgi:hypothetical protein